MRPNLTEAQWNEHTLMAMSDEHWAKVSQMLLQEQMEAGGSMTTGDAVADGFERQIAEENAARRAAKETGGGG